MPQIIVAADREDVFGQGAVTFRERVNVADFESGHFAAQLVERLGWAVEDADAVERGRVDPAQDADLVEPRRAEAPEEHAVIETGGEPARPDGLAEGHRPETVVVHAPV